jgi:hypothetical protein
MVAKGANHLCQFHSYITQFMGAEFLAQSDHIRSFKTLASTLNTVFLEQAKTQVYAKM